MPIPCRHCGKKLIPFTVQEGTHALKCPRCDSVTGVKVYREGDRWRVKSWPGR